MWCATSRRQHLFPASALSVDGGMVDPVTSVRDLSIYIDADLSMRTHVQRTVSCCFAVLRLLRQIRRLIPTATFQTLVVALVLSRLNYGNGALIGLPTYLVRRLQSVLNASARVIFQLHWLCIPERIQFKIAVLKYEVLHGTAPRYTWVRSSVCLICRVGVVSALPAPIAWSCCHSNCLLLAVKHLMLLLLEHGMVCRRM